MPGTNIVLREPQQHAASLFDDEQALDGTKNDRSSVAS